MASFTELYDAVRNQREKRDSAAALALLVGRENDFKLHSGLIYLIRAGILAESGRADEAFDALEEALAEGCRYKRAWLESDRALATLRTFPRFAEIVDRSDRRYEEDAAKAGPKLSTVFPSSDGTTDRAPLLVALHGNNSNMHLEFLAWWTATERGWLVAVPQSGEIGSTPDAYTWNDRERAANEIETHIAQLRREHSIHPGRLVLGGFSMGGLQAIALGLTGRIGATGVIAVAPWLPHVKEFSELVVDGRARRIPIYLLVGDGDPSYGGAVQLIDLLAAHGIPAHLEVRAGMGHQYPKDVGAWLGPALQFVSR